MKIDDAGLLAYDDGELSTDECAQVEKAIRESDRSLRAFRCCVHRNCRIWKRSTSKRCRRCLNP